MVPILLVLLLALILFGAGFAVKILWWIALAVLVLWLVGFFVRGRGAAGGGAVVPGGRGRRGGRGPGPGPGATRMGVSPAEAAVRAARGPG